MCGDDMLFKNTIIKIKRSFGRYFSLFIIVMIGVGFFAGIKGSAPDILAGVDLYSHEHQLMDFKIVSTLGLTEDDVTALSELSEAAKVIPSYSVDVLDSGIPIKVHAIESDISTMEVVDGRMPDSSQECVADTYQYQVGDKIEITSDVEDELKHTEYTVVGTVKTPLYMSTDYGNTTIGDGKLASFIFVNKAEFDFEFYTEIYLSAKSAVDAEVYSSEYKQATTALKKELAAIKSERQDSRYQEIFDEANDEINENQDKLNKEKKDAEEELADAKAELDENAEKLEDGKKELADNEKKLNNEVVARTAEFEDAKVQIADGWNQINTALDNNGIKQEELDGKLTELSQGIETMKQQLPMLPKDSQEQMGLSAQIEQYQAAYEGLVTLQASIQTLTEQETQLNEGIATFDEEISKARKKIADGKKELAENEQKLTDGYEEYEEGLAEFIEEINDAQQKIDDAREELADLEHPKWYINSRDDVIPGYESLKSSTDIIVTVADILPIFFILIVMLMTSNTMARMIMEERSELGTLASLGYKNSGIMATYLLYVLSATVLGAVIGFYVGSWILPGIVYGTFSMFILPPMILQYNIPSLIIMLLGAVLLMTAVTIFFCNMELKQKPADLLRPVPPKNGQKILLERIGFIWKHMSFTWKVTMRNIFRYKSRVFMIIIGVAGCTALLVTGFGLRDSVNGVADKQYGEIFCYDAMLALEKEQTEISGKLETLLEKEKVVDPLLMKQATYEVENLDAYINVPKDNTLFDKYYHLTDIESGAVLTLRDDGVIITKKLAETLGIKMGGTITISESDGDTYSMQVSDIAENYIGNYIFMSATYYDTVFDETVKYNMMVSKYNQEKSTLAEHLLESELIVNVTYRDDIVQAIKDGNESLNQVVVLLVVISSMLVIIVLYNLTSINISEREREIATLKVLGFYDREANSYIYREAFVLTMFSILMGCVLGIGLHRFLMNLIEDQANVFFKIIKPMSFIWSSMIIIIVSFIMQLVTYIKMRTIDMIEALKSVE